ncbi:MAG: carbohydrate binding family 9 domain-containing protein, partial [Chitinophagaceae bacterium]|nr:carbohydrate binding family 9 domain-containing protein [Chitinophagaceae bacterium]
MGFRWLFIALLCQVWCVSFSQKSITAVKASGTPKIDGNLDDAIWQSAPVATDFVQQFPNPGAPVSAKTEVRILYDNNAVYIGAYLYDDPSSIRKQFTTRDGEQRTDVDYFSVFFDTYNDQQNGFQFLVTAADVQSDAKLANTANVEWGEYGDKTWDAVWESKAVIKNDGWVAEIRIPYTSLRFPKKEVQTWGLQFLRFLRRNNENAFWNPVDPNINGFINQFGYYTNLQSIQPPLRLSFSPYLSTGIRSSPSNGEHKTEWLRNGGMDVKYGISESFTLDATVIPDFGQVVSDNIINNLSPFEVRFQEHRPFFTEGTELFNKSGLFYSRRIGAIPSGYNDVQTFAGNNPQYNIVKNPSVTQLYNGIKISGRTKKKLGVGIFNAVAAPMEARLHNTVTKKDTVIQTEPLTNYNLLVLDQAFQGRSFLTFTNANVIRNGNHRDANVSAVDWALFTKKNIYALSGTTRYSKIFGYTPYNTSNIFNTDSVRINGNLFLRPYDGFAGQLQFGKVSGKIQFFTGANLESTVYDPNDLGYLQAPNGVTYRAGISYNQFTPTEKFITYRYGLNVRMPYLFKPYKYSEVELEASALWVFRNFWDVTLTLNSFPSWQNNFFDLRTPGKFLRLPPEATVEVLGSTDSRKKWFFSYELGYAVRSVSNNSYNRYEFAFRYRFSDRFSLSTSLSRQYENNQRGFAFEREVNNDPIAGFRDYTES